MGKKEKFCIFQVIWLSYKKKKGAFSPKYQCEIREGTDNCNNLDGCSLVKVEMETLGGTATCVVGVEPALIQDICLGKDFLQFLQSNSRRVRPTNILPYLLHHCSCPLLGMTIDRSVLGSALSREW